MNNQTEHEQARQPIETPEKEPFGQKRFQNIANALCLISDIAHAPGDLEPLYASIHGIVATVMDAAGFHISAYDPSTHGLKFLYRADSMDVPSNPARDAANTHALAAEVIRSGRPILADKQTMDRLRARIQEKEPGRVFPRSWLGVPVKTSDALAGVMAVQNHTHANRFDFWDMKVLVCAARQLSMAMEQNQARKIHAQTEERFTALIKGLPGAVFALDPTGRFLLVNEAACTSTGYTQAEILGMNILDVDTTIKTPARLIALFDGLSPGHPATAESRFRRKDGTSFPVEMQTSLLHTPGGPRILGIVRDITEHKESKDALWESEERFQRMYKNMAVGMARVSMDFTIENANDAYCRMLGYTEEELMGKHLKDITHPETLEENLKKQSLLGKGEIDHFRMEKRFIHKSGQDVYGILDANLVRNAKGRPIYFLGSVLDVTELKGIEARLRRAAKMESIGNLAGGIAHDFNNILFPIVGLSELLLEDLPRAPGNMKTSGRS